MVLVLFVDGWIRFGQIDMSLVAPRSRGLWCAWVAPVELFQLSTTEMQLVHSSDALYFFLLKCEIPLEPSKKVRKKHIADQINLTIVTKETLI